jgi:hypothetical protein
MTDRTAFDHPGIRLPPQSSLEKNMESPAEKYCIAQMIDMIRIGQVAIEALGLPPDKQTPAEVKSELEELRKRHSELIALRLGSTKLIAAMEGLRQILTTPMKAINSSLEEKGMPDVLAIRANLGEIVVAKMNDPRDGCCFSGLNLAMIIAPDDAARLRDWLNAKYPRETSTEK